MRVSGLLLMAALPASALAQTGIAVGGDAGAGTVVLSPGATGVTQHGALIGGTLALVGGPVFFSARYAQGSMTGGGASNGTLVVGHAQLGLAPVSWLAVSVGPYAFALGNPAVERWLLWEGSVRLSAPLIGELARSYVEVRRSFGGDVNIGTGAPTGSGIGVGLLVRPPATPISVGLGYQFDRAELPAGPTRTVDAIWLSLRLSTHDLP